MALIGIYRMKFRHTEGTLAVVPVITTIETDPYWVDHITVCMAGARKEGGLGASEARGGLRRGKRKGLP